MGEAIAWAQQTAREELPDYAQVDWKGESREYQQSGSAVLLTFGMALLVVYLVLAAQFESFAHPLVIMLTVPLAVLGALVGLWLTGGTLNTGRFIANVKGNQGDLLTTLLAAAGVPLDRPIGIATKQIKEMTVGL